MRLSEAFQSELAAIDAALSDGIDSRLEEIQAEIDALTPRRAAAEARGLVELLAKIDAALEARIAQIAALTTYRSIAAPAPVTPAKARTPEPKPVTVAAIEAPKPTPAPVVIPAPIKPTVPRPKAVRLAQAFMKRERAFHSNSPWSRQREADLKSLVCEARGVIELSQEAGLDDEHLWQSVEMLQEEFNRQTDFAPFFAFNRGRTHRHEIWSDLAEAFRLLAVAESCLGWLEANQDAQASNRELIAQSVAAEAWVERMNDEHGLGFTDNLLRDVLDRASAMAEGIAVPYRNVGDRRMPTDQIIHDAKQLPTQFAEAARRFELHQQKASSIDTLQRLVESLSEDGPLESTLVPAVRQCLESGVAPSNKVLVQVCLPYRTVLRDVDERLFARLNEYLQKEETRMTMKHVVPSDPEEAVEESDPVRDEVREYLAGKTLLFVGGRRIPEKKRQIEEALGLKELMWPDADPDTLIHEFTSSVAKADVVCYLIRWSRHSYKQVIDLARAQGKATVTLKAGLGVNRLVHDVHDQLIARHEMSA